MYGATLAASGGVFFLAYSGDAVRLPAPARRTIGRCIVVFACTAAACSVGRILVTAASMSGDAAGMLDPALVHLVWSGGEGSACSVRIAGLLLVASGAVVARRPAMLLGVAGAALAATAFAWVGHTHAAAAPRGSEALAGLHLLCVAFWIGALPPLFVVTRDADRRCIAGHVQRFGRAALGVVGVLVGAGLLLLWSLVGQVALLWTSGYGRWALLKLAGVACLLVVAAFNKFKLTPRLAAHDSAAVPMMRHALQLEMWLAGLILLATAFLTTVTGPHSL